MCNAAIQISWTVGRAPLRDQEDMHLFAQLPDLTISPHSMTLRTLPSLTSTVTVGYSNFDEEGPFIREYNQIPGHKRLRIWRIKATSQLIVLNTRLCSVRSMLMTTMSRWKRLERAGCFDGGFVPLRLRYLSNSHYSSPISWTAGLVSIGCSLVVAPRNSHIMPANVAGLKFAVYIS